MNLPEAHDEQVKAYYDRNTRRFLWVGASRKPMSIHRAVWGPGVRTRTQALEYTNQLILAEMIKESKRFDPASLQVLDLGCGVGGTLFRLAQAAPIQAVGVTLSPVQAGIAVQTARRLGLSERCTFLAASYLDLPPLPPAHFAIAIESFVLGPDPARFFLSAAAALRPGAKLVIVDDFLSARAAAGPVHPRQAAWIAEFQTGWLANSLVTTAQAALLAEAGGLRLCCDRDLTSQLRLLGPRDRVVQAAVWLGHFLPLRSLLGRAYWASLVGGNALQLGLSHGILEYHMLVFERLK